MRIRLRDVNALVPPAEREAAKPSAAEGLKPGDLNAAVDQLTENLADIATSVVRALAEKAEPEKPLTAWKFTMVRDADGLLQEIVATPIGAKR